MGELFKSTFGIQMAHVPYRGTLPALNDVVAGHIQLHVRRLAPALPLIQAGKVRALGVTTERRVASAPEHAAARRGRRARLRLGRLAVGGGTGRRPKDISAKLNSAMNEAIAEADVQSSSSVAGLHPDRQGLARGARPLRRVGDSALRQGLSRRAWRDRSEAADARRLPQSWRQAEFAAPLSARNIISF